MKRRTFLASLSSLAALEAVPTLAAKVDEPIRTYSNKPPRKVVIGTTMQSFWGQYPGLRRRLEQLTGLVDEMAAQAKKVHKRGLDLAVLPEVSLTGEAGDDAVAHSVPYEGEIRDAFKRKALEHKCYIVVPTYLLDSKEKKVCSNAAILVERDGEVQGTYRKFIWSFPSNEKRWKAGPRRATRFRSLTATLASWESKSVTTWNSLMVGRSWHVTAQN